MGLFSKKPGGSAVGNFFRKATKVVGDLGIPGISGIAKTYNNFAGEAPPAVVEQANKDVAYAAALPPQAPDFAAALAQAARMNALSFGATVDEAATVARTVDAQAQASQDKLIIQPELPAGTANLSGTDLKNIGIKILEGGRKGGVDGFMETEEGKAAKKDAVDSTITQMLPKVLIGVICWIVYDKLINKNRS